MAKRGTKYSIGWLATYIELYGLSTLSRSKAEALSYTTNGFNYSTSSKEREVESEGEKMSMLFTLGRPFSF